MSGLGGIYNQNLQTGGLNEPPSGSPSPTPPPPDSPPGGYSDTMGAAGMMSEGALTGLGGLADLAVGIGARSQAKTDLQKANEELTTLKTSMPSLSTPAEYYDAVKNAYDQRILQMRTEDINRSLANTTQAASQYGSRGLGAVMGAQQQAQQAKRQEALTQQQLQTQALGNLASAREREIQLREARSTRDLDYAYDQRSLQEARLAQANQQIASGAMGAIGGAVSFGIGSSMLPKLPKTKGDKGLVIKTPGKYSHKENEMYVVDAAGKSVGIAITGGEYLIDPARAKRLASKSKDTSLKGMKVLRKEVTDMVTQFEDPNNGRKV